MADSTSCLRIGNSPSSVGSWQISTIGSPLFWKVYSSEQYSVHLFVLSSPSVRHFPSLSWMLVTLLCCCLVRVFTRWKAFFISLVAIGCSISSHWSSIHFSLASFVHFFICLFTFRYSIFPHGVFRWGSSSLRVSHMFRMSSVAHGWVLWRLKPRMSVATSVITSLKLLVMAPGSPSSSIRGPNLPPILASNKLVMFGSC